MIHQLVNPLRYVGEWTPGLVGVFVLACAIALINGWFYLRERRGDWGPGLTKVAEVGYAPADLRPESAPPLPEDPHERWLLGLAAPHVEAEGMRHDRWSLVPAPCDDRWRRRLGLAARRWGTSTTRAWRSELDRIEQDIEQARSTNQGFPVLVWSTANLAMLLRLGVAARFTNARRARKRLEPAAEALRGQCSSWLEYGDALVTMAEILAPGATTELRARMRRLYAPDGPWHEVAWPL